MRYGDAFGRRILKQAQNAEAVQLAKASGAEDLYAYSQAMYSQSIQRSFYLWAES